VGYVAQGFSDGEIGVGYVAQMFCVSSHVLSVVLPLGL
jgi:hypothetical protein